MKYFEFMTAFKEVKTKIKYVHLKDCAIRCTWVFPDIDKDYINDNAYVILYTHRNIKITEINTKDIIKVTESE